MPKIRNEASVKDTKAPIDSSEKSSKSTAAAKDDTAIENALAEALTPAPKNNSADAGILHTTPNADIPKSIDHIEMTATNRHMNSVEAADTPDTITSENHNNTPEAASCSTRRKKIKSKMPKTEQNAGKLRKRRILSFIICALLIAINGLGAFWFIGYTSVSNSQARYMLNQPCTVLPRSEQYTDAKNLLSPPSHHNGGFISVVGLGFERVFSAERPVAVSVEVEAGSQNISADSFLLNDGDAKFVTDMKALDTSVPGGYQIELDIDGQICHSLLFIIDTTPPTATVSDATAYAGAPLDAMNFFTNIVDETAVTAYYESEPDFSVPHETDVTVILEDSGKNSIRRNAKLTVIDDVVPPVITGAADRTVFIGDTISYKDGVAVTDNKDGEDIALDVDISKVNPTVPGQYPVTYSATDSTGLSASVTVTFTVKTQADQLLVDELNALIEPIYNSIIKDSMTPREKAYAIYKWTRNRIGYSGYSDKSDWRKAAIMGLKTQSGDCFTYFAVAKALLEYVGIDNIDVIKIEKPGRPMHYWSLINLGEGWYHFDSTKWSYEEANLFMLTDAQIDAFSRSHLNSHDFDHSLYPATPKS